MSQDKSKIDSQRDLWLKTAKSRLRFELAGLAFAIKKGGSPEEYARYLWSQGAKSWMKRTSLGAGEYLEKEATALRGFYPEVGFEIIEAGKDRAELVFTAGCLGGWGDDSWALARSLGLSQEDVCRYCREAFLVWAKQLGLLADIGLDKDGACRLLVTRP